MASKTAMPGERAAGQQARARAASNRFDLNGAPEAADLADPDWWEDYATHRDRQAEAMADAAIDEFLTEGSTVHRAAQTDVIKQFVKMSFAFVVGVIILNELFGLSIVTNDTGPFSSTLDTLETILGAALVFVVLGLLAYGGSVAMSYMNAF